MTWMDSQEVRGKEWFEVLKEKCGDGPDDWFPNNKNTKVFIISADTAKDEEAARTLEQTQISIEFVIRPVTDFADAGGLFSIPVAEKKEYFLSKVRDIKPTHIVLNFPHGFEPTDLLRGQDLDLQCRKDSILEELDDKRHIRLGKLLIIEDKYIMFATKHFYMTEGAILMTPNATSGNGITEELKKMLVKHVKKKMIDNNEDTKVLTITGTHGDSSGVSALTDINQAEYELYEEDCKKIGILPHPDPDTQAPKKPKNAWPDGIPPISDIKKAGGSNNGFQDDNRLDKMTFQGVNLAHYTGKTERLIQDIKEFQPAVLILAWCYSNNGDVAMALRREAVFARMVMDHDIREVTKNVSAKASDKQVDLIQKMFMIMSSYPAPQDLARLCGCRS